METKQEKRIIQIASPCFGEEEWEALREPIVSGWITQGPKVAEFEKLFAERHKVKYAVAVSSCTAALHLALLAIGIGPGDEVLVPAFTWIATANAVLYCGATPVFVDIDPRTFNIDPSNVKEKITARTKAIIPVHLFGLCADIHAIRNIAPHLKIVEDAACAAGAAYKEESAGGLGDIGCFSFHPRKSITTGEGGMVTTNDDALAKKVDIMRNHGASISEEIRHRMSKPHFIPDFDIMGFNYRMTDLQGAVGVVQIKKLNQFIRERQQWADCYSNAFQDISWMRIPQVPEKYEHGWQAYVVWIDEGKSPLTRNEIMEYLQEKGIATRPGTHAVHALHFYTRKYNIKPSDYPNAYAASKFSMAIPLHNHLSDEDYEYIIHSIKSLT